MMIFKDLYKINKHNINNTNKKSSPKNDKQADNSLYIKKKAKNNNIINKNKFCGYKKFYKKKEITNEKNNKSRDEDISSRKISDVSLISIMGINFYKINICSFFQLS